MKIEDLRYAVLAFQCCQAKLLAHCTNLNVRIGKAIAILNAIVSLLD